MMKDGDGGGGWGWGGGFQKYQKKLDEWRHSGIAIVNLEHTEDIDLVFSLCKISMMKLFCEAPFTI